MPPLLPHLQRQVLQFLRLQRLLARLLHYVLHLAVHLRLQTGG